jgi:hypothetical protein
MRQFRKVMKLVVLNIYIASFPNFLSGPTMEAFPHPRAGRPGPEALATTVMGGNVTTGKRRTGICVP